MSLAGCWATSKEIIGELNFTDSQETLLTGKK
jgi:hypothetical protein